MQKMLSYVRRAVDHYNMIKEGDRVAVGVSGGKDSLALLVALTQLSRFYPAKVRGRRDHARNGLRRNGFFACAGALRPVSA